MALLLCNMRVGYGAQTTIKPWDAIVYLYSGEDMGRFKQLGRSLDLLFLNYLDRRSLEEPSRDVKIVIFHDTHLSQGKQQIIEERHSVPFRFVNIENHRALEPPPWRAYDKPDFRWARCAGRIWRDDYVYMNIFRTGYMYTHTALDGAEYIMRLDTDLYLEKAVPFDLFDRMRSDALTYAYHECTFERAEDCLDGLPNAMRAYLTMVNVDHNAGHMDRIDWRTAYAGNFGIARLSFFRSKEYISLVQFLLNRKNMYRARWADQNIWALALALFCNKTAVANWHQLFDDGFAVHRSAGLGRLINAPGPSRATPNICKHEFGCICTNSNPADLASAVYFPPLKHSTISTTRPCAYVTYAFNDEFIRGVRVLFSSLKRSGSIDGGTAFCGGIAPALAVMDVGYLSDTERTKLKHNLDVVLIGPDDLIPLDSPHAARFLDRYQGRQAHHMFTKLNIFGLHKLFSRIVYLDADIVVLKSIANLFDKFHTPALAAVPEREGLEPEFNAGFLVLDPSADLFAKLRRHLADDSYLCGFRATDQSYLCHFFHPSRANDTAFGGTWHALPRSYQALWKDARKHPKQALENAHVLHFNGGKPWKRALCTGSCQLLEARWHEEDSIARSTQPAKKFAT